MFKIFGLRPDGQKVYLHVGHEDAGWCAELMNDVADQLGVNGNPQKFTQVIMRTEDGKDVDGFTDEQDVNNEVAQKHTSKFGPITCPICRHDTLCRNCDMDDPRGNFGTNVVREYYCDVCGVHFWIPDDLENELWSEKYKSAPIKGMNFKFPQQEV